MVKMLCFTPVKNKNEFKGTEGAAERVTEGGPRLCAVGARGGRTAGNRSSWSDHTEGF